MAQRIIGIDPGSESCGMVVLDGGRITGAWNLTNSQFWGKVTNYLINPSCVVVIEDIRPYSLRLTPQVIDTCKFIGEAVFRLKSWSGATVRLITRNEVKKWVFDTFPEVCIPGIEKKILKKGFVNRETGQPRKPSFIFVDDKLVMESMKVLYKIPMPVRGYGYQHGLKDHSWQALATATTYLHKLRNKLVE